MRSFKATRRAARREQGKLEPVPFEVVYADDLGEEVRAVFNAYGEMSAATMADGAYFADRGIDSPEGAAVIRQGFVEMIDDEDEFRRFWAVARKLDEDDLVDIFGGLLEETLGRPTTPPSDSSATSSTTGTGSSAASSPAGSSPVATPTVFSD